MVQDVFLARAPSSLSVNTELRPETNGGGFAVIGEILAAHMSGYPRPEQGVDTRNFVVSAPY